MSWGKRYFGLVVILEAYKKDKIDLREAVTLFRAIVRGIGMKDAKEFIEQTSKKEK
jgi:ribosomal protein L7/L12